MLTRLGRPSTVINGANEAQALVLAHTLTTHLRNKFESLIRAHPRRPILMTYMSDGWGSNVFTKKVTAVAGDIVIRNARFRHEF